jgi:dTDP-L-rhamnose 4-epimerase
VRVLLTGAAGFIGSTIADLLLARGDELVAVDLLLPKAHGVDGARGTQWAPDNLIVGDIRDRELVERLLPGVDVVCHQAAMVGLGVDAGDAPDYAGHNVLGTAVLLAAMAASGVRSVVQASSMVVYGEGRYLCARHGDVRPGPRLPEALTAGDFDPPCPVCGAPLQWAPISEDAPLDPRNTYAASKLAQEHFAAAWARQTSSSVTSLRYHNVYGPRMPRDTPYAGVAAIFRSALESGRAPRVYEDGGQMRDFIHVHDIAAANLAAIDRLAASPATSGGQVLACNISTGDPHTVGQLAAALAMAMGGRAPEVVGGGRAGDVRHVVADPALAARVLGFRASRPFAQGIGEFATAPMRPPAT